MLLDHSHTKAILIGNSEYEGWPDLNIKNIDVNLKELKAVLCDPNLVGIRDDPSFTTVLPNMPKTKILLSIEETVEKCTEEDTLLIYYAGHGLLLEEDMNKLFMSTADTISRHKKTTCVSSEELKEKLAVCKARNKIMILDCCYAARMVKGLQSDLDSLRRAQWSNSEGIYFLMSSDIDTPSRFDPDDDKIPTFFTQKMIQTIKDGADRGNSIWTLDDFYENMKTGWNVKKAPEPLRLTVNTIGELPFCYNRFRFSKSIGAPIDDEERLFNEIELEPTDDKLKNFIDNTKNPELIDRAVQLWGKLSSDYEDLDKAIEAKTFEALKRFLLEKKPLNPVKRIATEKMKSFGIENRYRSTNQSNVGSNVLSKEKSNSDAGSPSRLST